MVLFRSFLAAIQFLTILPVPLKTAEKDLDWSPIWYPIVGAGLGAALGFFCHWMAGLADAPLAAALTIFLYIILTRGMHLDGWMDTVDGFFSGKGRERILAIMREPGVGSFAILAAGIWILLIYAGLNRLSWLDLLVLHMLTRHSILWLPLFFSYPVSHGTGRFFFERSRKSVVSLGTLFSLLVLFWAGPRYYWYLLISLAVSLAVGFWARRKIGGVTGDVCGFVIEANHVVLLVTMAIASLNSA
jgi:adenosylcobinamide-GDP ribazoletransferase